MNEDINSFQLLGVTAVMVRVPEMMLIFSVTVHLLTASILFLIERNPLPPPPELNVTAKSFL